MAYAADAVPPNRHPRGLYFLFTTEMWERFSYYGMRAILVYYMVSYLFLPGAQETVFGYNTVKGLLESIFGPLSVQALSSQIYGLYTGFVYFTPFFGGLLADRVLGQRKTVILGAVLMAIGEFMLMFEALFFPALLFLIVGNGAFKPNISTQVGGLYPPGDHRRDRAFSIFYVGINLGATFSPLVCGTLGTKVGWKWGFCAAGIGMVIGLLVYLMSQRHLAADNIMRTKAGEVTHQPLTKSDKSKIWALVILCSFNIVFWGTYEQQGNTMALWARDNSDRHLFSFLGIGWEMNEAWFQAVNPIMIFLLTPLVIRFWAWQAKRGKEPTSIAKMCMGCFLLGSSYIVMILAARLHTDGSLASMWWLIGATLVLTIGELYLSPVGLSLVTKLAPARMVSMLMGMWFLSSFFGNYLCGFLGTFWERMPKEMFFLMLCILASSAGLAMLAVLKPLKRAISHGEPVEVDV